MGGVPVGPVRAVVLPKAPRPWGWRGVGRGTAPGRSPGRSRSSRPNHRPVPAVVEPGAAACGTCSSDFAGWEVHTRGVGSRLLAKMGYEFGKGERAGAASPAQWGAEGGVRQQQHSPLCPQVWAGTRTAGWSPSTPWCCPEGSRWTSARRSCSGGPGAARPAPAGPQSAAAEGAGQGAAHPLGTCLTFSTRS